MKKHHAKTLQPTNFWALRGYSLIFIPKIKFLNWIHIPAISSILPNFLSGIGSGGSVRTVIPISLLVEAMVLSIVIGMVSGEIPAYRASKLKPVDALRYE